MNFVAKQPAQAKGRRLPKAPKHRRILELLRKQILEGVYAPGVRLPTETELPKLLKVGKQTVVRALNELVREGLVVRRRGDGSYVADRQRPPLLVGRHLRLAILWPRSVLPERLFTEFWGAITRGVLEAWGLESGRGEWPRVGERDPTHASWSSVASGVTAVCLGESLYSRERHPDFELLRAGGFDGVLSISLIEEPFLEQVLGLGLPTVLVDFPNERFATRADQVYVDPLPGFRAAVRHFAERGLRRIHYLGTWIHVAAPSPDMPPEEVIAYQAGKQRPDPDSLLRLGAWRVGMNECGLSAPESWVHFAFHSDEPKLAEQMLALPETERPEAVVCHSELQAERLMKLFVERGLALRTAGATTVGYKGPALPILIDPLEVGRTAAELLVWKLHQKQRLPLRVGVPMSLEATPAKPVPVRVAR